jgi:uncharacterized RDD family membrane protein YckC
MGAAGTGRRLDLFYEGGAVQSIRFDFDATVGRATFTDAQRPPLPADATLIDAAAGRDGPTVLIEHDGRRLLAAGAATWIALDLPDALPDAATVRMVTTDRPEAEIMLIARHADRSATVFTRDDQQWSRHHLAIEIEQNYDALVVWGQVVLVDAAKTGRTLRARVWTGSRVIEAGTLPRPDGPTGQWAATAYRDRLAVIFAAEPIQLVQRDLRDPPRTPATGASLRIVPWSWWQTNQRLITYGLLVVLLIVIVVALRPAHRINRIQLPPTMRLATATRRGLSAVIDTTPGFIVVWAVTGIDDPLAVIGPWLSLSDNWAAKAPAVAVMLITVIHCTLGEWKAGTTLGKRVTRCRVVDYDGRPPRGAVVLIRNAMKMLEMLLWPLLVSVLLSPVNQRLGDQVARTVVIDRTPATPDTDQPDPHTPHQPERHEHHD